MSASLQSLISCGTKLWLDSVDPDLVRENAAAGATGATSNPIIVADLIKSGRFDSLISQMLDRGDTDEQICWGLTDHLVTRAEGVFRHVWERTKGDDGYVSFELDPLLEDPARALSLQDQVEAYIESGVRFSREHPNRMIKIPATPGGLAALEELAAAGVPLNVTLIFSDRQHREACEAIWRGAQRRSSLDHFKSVYSIFVSRIDVYTQDHVPQLSNQAQGLVGILNAQRIWQNNQSFWRDKHIPLKQEIVFASTGTKKPSDPPWKYVYALAGSDIQTNPPATNRAVATSQVVFERRVDQLPPSDVVEEIDRLVDFARMESVLMKEGIDKFAVPQKQLLQLIADKRTELCVQ